MEVMDISAPGMDKQRDFMRAGAKKKEGQINVLPPQIFNGEKYCGVSYIHIGSDYISYWVYHLLLHHSDLAFYAQVFHGF